ncbi:hypothetical protein DA2_2432 [Desulfovibrio sp. A2]|nr:hypothetical protein DA2_2432 [Desulfovibrio sp. A2]
MENMTSRREGESFFSDLACIFNKKSCLFRDNGHTIFHCSRKQHIHYVSYAISIIKT